MMLGNRLMAAPKEPLNVQIHMNPQRNLSVKNVSSSKMVYYTVIHIGCNKSMSGLLSSIPCCVRFMRPFQLNELQLQKTPSLLGCVCVNA